VGLTTLPRRADFSIAPLSTYPGGGYGAGDPVPANDHTPPGDPGPGVPSDVPDLLGGPRRGSLDDYSGANTPDFAPVLGGTAPTVVTTQDTVVNVGQGQDSAQATTQTLTQLTSLSTVAVIVGAGLVAVALLMR
jgi:hypothetical protein